MGDWRPVKPGVLMLATLTKPRPFEPLAYGRVLPEAWETK